MCYGDGFRGGGVLLGNLGGVLLACSRLSDSGEDAKVKGTRKVGGAKKGKPLLSSVSSRFTFVFALSQFSGLNYLEAWNRLWFFHTRFQTRPLKSIPGPKCIVFLTFSVGKKQKSGFMLAAVSLGRKITVLCFLSVEGFKPHPPPSQMFLFAQRFWRFCDLAAIHFPVSFTEIIRQKILIQTR